MFCSRTPLLPALLSTSAVVTLALAWFGWRNLEQESSIELQRMRDSLETGADAVAVGIRGKLAEAGERLSAWISSPGSPVPSWDGAAIVAETEERFEIAPPGALPFVPVSAPIQASDRTFVEAESIEFGGNSLTQAAELYRKLSRDMNPRIRAEAILRLGRVMRKLRDFAGATEAYRSLAAAGDVLADGLPAELLGLDGQRLTFALAGDQSGERRVAAQIARLIDHGRWLLSRGSAEFYREAASHEPRPETWLLAEALARLWETERSAASSTASLRVTLVEGRPVLALWRSNGQRSAALVSFAEPFVTGRVPRGYGFQLVDSDGQRIAGAQSTPAQTVARIIGRSPWMLRIWPEGADALVPTRPGPRFLLAMLAVVILFLWGTVYFMARAMRREAEVSRLQSDFVAAVSHEFRSPLTTVRQLSEMLEMGTHRGLTTAKSWHNSIFGIFRPQDPCLEQKNRPDYCL